MSNLANQSLETQSLQTVDVAALFLAASTSSGCAALVVSIAVDLLVGSACVAYRFDPDRQESAWRAIGFAGEVSLEQSVLPFHNRLFAQLIAEPQYSITHFGAELRREEFGHLQVTRSIASISYLPFTDEDRLIGALEVISFSNALSSADLKVFDPLLRLAPSALLRIEQFEQEKENLLDSVHRLTQLYDLEKSLNTTLDLDHVMALIPRKVLPMLQCQAIHLWLFDGDVLTLKASSGTDETVYVGMTQAPGEGYVADMAEEGKTLLLSDPNDERLLVRNGETASPIWTAMLVPLMEDEAEVGVLEAVN